MTNLKESGGYGVDLEAITTTVDVVNGVAVLDLPGTIRIDHGNERLVGQSDMVVCEGFDHYPYILLIESSDELGTQRQREEWRCGYPVG